MRLDRLVERILAGRWIAGPAIADAVATARTLNAQGMRALINYLGEDFTSKSDIDDAVNTYLKLIMELKKTGAKADISVKPTQLGLSMSAKEFARNYRHILAFAAKHGVFVWLDMEDSKYVTQTISAFISARSHNKGICIQAYLSRSFDDVRKLVRHNAVIRLVKGAYVPSTHARVGDKHKTNSNFIKIMRYLFGNSKEFMIATHDDAMISIALGFAASSKAQASYAMLNGIRREYAHALASSGQRVSIYVPFGKRWVQYAYRRLKEQGHAILILRSIFGG